MSDKKKRKDRPADKSQQKALFVSLREGNHDKVRKLVKDRVVDVNEPDEDDPRGATAIITASELGDVEMVKILMKAKPNPADVNAETITGRRAIWWAAKLGNKELADQLLSGDTKSAKCEVNYIDRETGSSPLYRAIVSNTAPVVRSILHGGGDVNLRKLGLQKGAETPLIKSVQMNNLEIVEMLINSLCKKNDKTDDGLTALHYSVAYRRYDIAKFLLQEKVKIHSRSNSGVTAMTVAIEQHNPAMVKILIEHGYRLDRPYRWGEMPIQQAISLHSQECAMTLAYWGCDLTTPAPTKKTSRKRKPFSAFYMAVDERLMTLARLLIDLNPWFLRESWLWEREWPVSLYRRPLVRKWLKEQASTPRSLQNICRARIFKCLGLYAPHKAEQLPLPASLLRYLTFPEYIKDKFYQERPLSEEDCPFDCDSSCPLWTCPVIDISFSDDSDQEIEIWE